MGWTGHVVGMEWIRHVRKVLVGISEGNRVFTSIGRGLEDNNETSASECSGFIGHR
jgi:hypothetical protein